MNKVDDIIKFIFSKKINTAFLGIFYKGSKIKYCSAWQCYFCSNYYVRKDKFDCHFENCTGQTGYVYDFNAQNLLTFEEI